MWMDKGPSYLRGHRILHAFSPFFILPIRTNVSHPIAWSRAGSRFCISRPARALDSQLDVLGPLDLRPILLQRQLDLAALSTVAHDLLGAPADEVLRLHHAVDVGLDAVEERRALDALDEVVLAALLLDDVAGLVAQHAHLLVRVLARLALRHQLHDDVLRRHERQLLHDARVRARGVHDEPGDHVVKRHRDGVGGQEELGDRDAADGRVVEGALEPLLCARGWGVSWAGSRNRVGGAY